MTQAASAPRVAIEPNEAHVLVVEDNVPNFVFIARMLNFMGVQRCEWKTCGWQVVQFADTMPRIDLILMDIRLPYEDGYQALEKVRGESPPATHAGRRCNLRSFRGTDAPRAPRRIRWIPGQAAGPGALPGANSSCPGG